MDVRGPVWALNENGKPHGEYDAVVVAHNGKVSILCVTNLRCDVCF